MANEPTASGDGDAWASLMARAQDGDRAAYQQLLTAIAPYLRAIARRYLGRGDEVDDAVQEILMVVHGIRHTYERGRPIKPWLATIASRRCIDLLRKRTYRMKHEWADLEHLPEPGDDETPLDATARDDDARRLHEAIEALPERQREAVRLLRIRELSLGEAAAHSRQTSGALKVAYHRALKTLRRTLGPEDAPDE